MKTKGRLNALKEEVETVNRKPQELTDEELAQVSSGATLETSLDGELFKSGKQYFVHVKATGQIIIFTNQNDAEAYFDSLSS